MSVLREENFGGILFDREKLKIKILDKKSFERLKDRERDLDLVVVKGRKGILTLNAPTKVFLVISKRCNLRCVHCSTNSDVHASEELSYQVIKDILAQLKKMGVFEIGIIGGEPLYHPQFFEIIQLGKKMGFPIYLNTNGVYGKNILKQLARSGIEAIKVSVDGLEETNDRIRGIGTFKKAVASIKYLKETGNRIRINYTLTRQNECDVMKMIKLADELACSIKIAPVVKIGRARKLKEKSFSVNEGIHIFQRIKSFCEENDIGVPVEIVTELYARSCSARLASADFLHTRCGGRYMHMIIDSDGTAYKTGNQIEVGKKYAVGKIHNESMVQLWEKANFKNEQMRKKRNQCKNCNIERLIMDSFERFSDQDWKNL
jgi:radical SAM protein with 4Fe4S-binding SPASM domain